jgi:hypothetical protein
MTVTVNLPEELLARLTAEAARRGVSVDQVAIEVLAAGLPEAAPPSALRRFAFIGMGASGAGGGDVGRRHDEILREEFVSKTARDV